MKLSNSQLYKLKSGIKNGTEVILNLLSNANGDSNEKTNFPQKSSLADRQVSRLCKAFANNSSANIKLSKTQLSKEMQSGGFLGKLLRPLLKSGFPLMKNVLKLLAKSILIPLGLTAAASAADTGIHKKTLELGMTTLIISNQEMDGIMRIVKYNEETGFLIKGVSEYEAKGQSGRCLSMLLGTSGAILLGDC